MRNLLILILLALVFSFAGQAFSEEDPHKDLFTDKMLNGRFIAGLSDEEASIFVQGVIDGIGKAAPGTLGSVYPGKSREDVVTTVKQFYRDNPDKLDLAVANVLMAGCK